MFFMFVSLIRYNALGKVYINSNSYKYILRCTLGINTLIYTGVCKPHFKS